MSRQIDNAWISGRGLTCLWRKARPHLNKNEKRQVKYYEKDPVDRGYQYKSMGKVKAQVTSLWNKKEQHDSKKKNK